MLTFYENTTHFFVLQSLLTYTKTEQMVVAFTKDLKYVYVNRDPGRETLYGDREYFNKHYLHHFPVDTPHAYETQVKVDGKWCSSKATHLKDPYRYQDELEAQQALDSSYPPALALDRRVLLVHERPNITYWPKDDERRRNIDYCYLCKRYVLKRK